VKINAAVGFAVQLYYSWYICIIYAANFLQNAEFFFCLDMQLCFYFELPVFMLRIMCELGILFTRFSYFYYIYVM